MRTFGIGRVSHCLLLGVAFWFLAHRAATQGWNVEVVGHIDTPGTVWDVAVSGALACVADRESGLQIIDVSNPSAPTLRGSYNTPASACGVAVSGTLAYVADDRSGLQIIDVSNPSAPTLRGSYDTPGYAVGVAVSGALAYVADERSGLQIIDVSNPSAPTLRGSYNTPGWAWGVAVSGALAYVADGYSGLQIIDVSNPSSPTLRGSYDTPGYAVGVAVSGALAYVADWWGGLQIIDVSNPSAPTLRGSYDTPDSHDVAVSGALAYVADGVSGLQIIDVSNPSSPTLRGSYDTPSWAYGVAVSRALAYVGDYGSGLWILRYIEAGRMPQSIQLGQAVEAGVEQFAYGDFELNFQAGQAASLLVRVTPLEGTGTWQLLGRKGNLPTLARSDWETDQFTPRGTLELLVPSPEAGLYYFSVFYSGGQQAGRFRIEVLPADFYLSDVTPRRAGNVGQATLEFRGLGFTTDTVARLSRGAQTIAGETPVLTDSTEMFVRFDLTGAPAGLYDVTVEKPGTSPLTLAETFEITPGIGPRLEARLIVPETVRGNRSYTLWVEYGNSGDADLAAPLFIVSSPQTDPLLPMTGREGGLHLTHPVQVLGISLDGAPGVLRPGTSYRIPIYFRSWTHSNTIAFSLETMIVDNRPIDWAAIEAEVRPDDVDPDGWAVIWSNLRAQIGSTWADYHRALTENAAYLALHGHRTYDVQELFAFELSKASGALSLRQTLASAVDVFAPARGLPLAFLRTTPQSIDQRFRLGPLGRGWSHGFEYSLSRPDQYTAVVKQPGGGRRQFVRYGTWWGDWQAGPGDYGRLNDLGGGAFELREKDGLLRRFDGSGRLNRIEEPNGNRLTMTYDGSNRLTAVVHSNGQSLTVAYNAQGRIQQITDHAGRLTEYHYDPSGEHLLAAVAPGNCTTSYTYQSSPGGATNHALNSITYPDGTHRYFAYDSRGRLAEQSLDGGVERVQFSYDDAGTVQMQDASGAVTAFHLGPHGEVLESEDPLGNDIRFSHDNRFNLSRLRGSDGAMTNLAYDGFGNPTAIEDPLRHVVRMRHTGDFSRLACLHDARGNATEFESDARGNLTAIRYPDGSRETFEYDAVGNMIRYRNRRGQSVTFTYNSLGQVTRKDYSDGRWVTYVYDTTGRVTQVTDTSGTIAIQYDARDFLTRIQYPSGHWYTFSYNDAGQRTQRVGHDGYALNYQYDPAGRLTRLTDGASSEIIRYEYDAAGRLSREIKGNGTYTTYEYDVAGQILHMVNYAPGGPVQSRFDYVYDVNGNRTSMTTLEGTTQYDYDALGQLVGVTYPTARRTAYDYDPAGNRVAVVDGGTTTIYTTNNMNQYTHVGTDTYAYDADGNMVSKTDSQGLTTYVYDIDNRLVSVSTPTSGTWQYGYDAVGNRISVTHDSVVTQYLHDPIGLVDVAAEYSGGGALVARYIHGLGLVSRTDAGGSAAYYSFDAIGHTRQVTNAAGTVANCYAYEPFGILLQVTEGIPNAFEFNGRFGVLDGEPRLILMRARFYAPSLGRFVGVDPLRLGSGHSNSYIFCQNRPTMLADPSGRIDLVTALFIAGTVAYLVEYHTAPYWQHVPYLLDFLLARLPGVPPPTLAGLLGIATAPGNLNRVGELLGYLHQGLIDTLWLSGRGWQMMGEAFASWWANQWYRIGYWWWTRNLPSVPNTPLATGSVLVIGPWDPNEKLGPVGVGSEHAIGPHQTLQYTIYFENMSTATAPAQEVIITDFLDPDLDWSTFELGDVAFGNATIASLAGKKAGGDRITLTSSPLVVDLEAQLYPLSGMARWTLRTIDPATDELTTDPLAGFLPPNDATGRGEGHVSFTIRPRALLAGGTRITNSATIVFDVEAPVTTNEVFNTIQGPTAAKPYWMLY